ncbi:MAG: PAS domain S-box protein [Deltaproteobacteria bacterium]|jgi:rsbT co-antagonist protein RsbR
MAEKRQSDRQKMLHNLTVYERIFENIEEEILLLDRNFQILWANNKVEKYGRSVKEVIGGHCYHITHNSDRPCKPPYDICPVEEVLRTGDFVSVLHTHFDREGNKIYAEVSAYPVYEKGEISEFIHIARDVTERVQSEERLKAQQKSILELSTPVVKIWDEIIALPLIGIIDSGRAKQIMESLLQAIVETQAAIAIIDITGVPMVDTEVADRLLRTIKAAGMLGTKCMMVGIKPDIAQSIVHLGVDLEDIETYSSLQRGLAAAFQQVGLEVVSK